MLCIQNHLVPRLAYRIDVATLVTYFNGDALADKFFEVLNFATYSTF